MERKSKQLLGIKINHNTRDLLGMFKKVIQKHLIGAMLLRAKLVRWLEKLLNVVSRQQRKKRKLMTQQIRMQNNKKNRCLYTRLRFFCLCMGYLAKVDREEPVNQRKLTFIFIASHNSLPIFHALPTISLIVQ